MTLIGAQGQVHKRFINKFGEATKDSTRAVSYILYQHLPDSSWFAITYDMKKVAKLKATYLDEELTMMHGKAVYYHTLYRKYIMQGKGSFIDTTLGVKTAGYYANGRREGVWVDFFDNGRKHQMQTFTADTLDGEDEAFYESGSIFHKGVYVKGVKEGDWYNYYPDSTVHFNDYYKRGRRVKSDTYDVADRMQSADPGFNVTYRIFKQLKKAGFPVIKGFVPISFTVGTDGRINNATAETDDLPLKNAIIDALVSGPRWSPAKLKSQPVEQKINVILMYRYSDDDPRFPN
ncbi:hypothetical protein [Mucilaginibacter sp.]|uniref:hypothetical protein n=1 Tax=Mucilaginibacter sp. TaxID=1882438 RepID=UPI0032675F6E